MDWNRARVLLLATFAALNLLLAYLLLSPEPAMLFPALPADWRLRDIQAQLKAQGLELRTSLPSHGPVLPFLRIAAPTPAEVQRVTLLLQELVHEVGGNPAGAVSAREDGTVLFAASRPLGGPVRMDRQAAIRGAAHQFLREHGLGRLADLRWSRTYVTGTGWAVVEYVPYVQGKPLFAGKVLVGVTAAGVRDVTVYLPHVEGSRGEPRAVLPAGEALLRLAGHLRAMRTAPPGNAARGDSAGPGTPGDGGTAAGYMPFPPIRVVQVTLGYYAPQLPSARSWDTVPTWRVVTDEGAVFYINAFTGELEGPK